jgi:VanZ family protein
MSYLWRVVFYWFPPLLYIGLIFSLSSFSHFSVELPSIPHIDKVMHFGEYFILALLLARALYSIKSGRMGWKVFWITLLFAAVLGGLDEVYQKTVPHRSSDPFDALADTIGGITGAYCYVFFRIRFARKEKESSAEHK